MALAADGHRRVRADVPDTAANATAFGYPAGAREHPAFPKVRVVTIGECGSHAKVAAQMGPVGGKGSSEQALARCLFARLEEDWLLIADRGFYNWADWQAAATTGAALLWRVMSDLRLPVLIWLVLAAHEIPQELGDFGILIHAGWSRRAAFAYNLASGSTVIAGALIAWDVNTAVLLPFAVGDFAYIALADLVPELTTTPAPHEKAILTTGFATGLLLLALTAALAR